MGADRDQQPQVQPVVLLRVHGIDLQFGQLRQLAVDRADAGFVQPHPLFCAQRRNRVGDEVNQPVALVDARIQGIILPPGAFKQHPV